MNDPRLVEDFQYTDFDGHFKDPILYDDVKLKKMVCSHLEQQKFIDNTGNEQMRCSACGMWDSEAAVVLKEYYEEDKHWGVNIEAEMKGRP